MKDIVHRLREPMNVLQYDDITEEAAEEIERLRAELKVMTEEHRLACDDRDQMRAERDRARRTLCQVLVLTRPPGSKQGERGFAKEMGWDCYERTTHEK